MSLSLLGGWVRGLSLVDSLRPALMRDRQAVSATVVYLHVDTIALVCKRLANG